ncbi:MAG: hypothetical protein ACQEP8_00140 [Chlamydiota bacterium]
MLTDSNLENKIAAEEYKLKQLNRELEAMERETAELHDQIGVLPQELERFLTHPENFSASLWEKYQEIIADLKYKLKKSRKNIVNPRSSRRKFRELRDAAHWIPVR